MSSVGPTVEAPAGLLDLPADALLHLICLLPSVRDLVSVAASSRFLWRLCRGQESLWLRQVEAWLAAQTSPSNGLSALTAAQLLHAFPQLGGSYRLLYQVLHKLGSWPAGVWYATHPGAFPRGMLVVGQLDPLNGSLYLREARSRALQGPTDSQDCWDLVPGVSLQPELDSRGSQVSLAVSSTSGFHCSMQLSLDGQSLLVSRSREPRQLLPVPGSRTFPPCAEVHQSGAASQALTSLAQYLGAEAARIRVENWQFCRVLLPEPTGAGSCDMGAAAASSAVAAAGAAEGGELPGMALLREWQGLVQGSYGPHGLEVLHLTASSAAEDVPPLCPITGPRLQAVKLLGDPNVPALKHSFVADASSCRLGGYQPQDDPFAPGEGLARPVLAFYESATLMVDIQSRPVKARFRAVGCINVVPGLWQPEWVPATLLLYDAPLHRTCTVIFEDAGEPFRHAIDFQEFPLVAEDFVSSARGGTAQEAPHQQH